MPDFQDLRAGGELRASTDLQHVWTKKSSAAHQRLFHVATLRRKQLSKCLLVVSGVVDPGFYSEFLVRDVANFSFGGGRKKEVLSAKNTEWTSRERLRHVGHPTHCVCSPLIGSVNNPWVEIWQISSDSWIWEKGWGKGKVGDMKGTGEVRGLEGRGERKGKRGGKMGRKRDFRRSADSVYGTDCYGSLSLLFSSVYNEDI